MNMNGKINEKMKESTDTLCLTTYITILDKKFKLFFIYFLLNY